MATTEKICHCNVCGFDFVCHRSDEARIKCKRCGSNQSLSITTYSVPFEPKTGRYLFQGRTVNV